MKNYIPKTKDDMASIEVLRSCSFEEIKNDVPELLVWIQDLHWDVAREVASYLVPHVNEIKKELIDVLDSNDSEWKFSALVSVIGESPTKLDPELVLVLKRIYENPSEGDVREEVDALAKKILSRSI